MLGNSPQHLKQWYTTNMTEKELEDAKAWIDSISIKCQCGSNKITSGLTHHRCLDCGNEWEYAKKSDWELKNKDNVD